MTAPTATATSVWKLDPSHTAVEFSAKHLMITTVRGRFPDVEGTVTVRIDRGQMVVRGRRGSAAYPLTNPDTTGTVRHGAL